MKRLLITLLLLVPGLAVAGGTDESTPPAPSADAVATADEARSLYENGAFAEAYELAAPVEMGEAQLTASRAAVAHALYVAEEPREQATWLERSRTTAERAVALLPDDPTPHLALARARGELARRGDALSNVNVAGEVRDLIDAALAADPDYPEALVALGAWHLELTERGVGWMFGARSEQALPLIEQGVAAAPGLTSLRIEYAKALEAVGDEGGAVAQLEAAVALPATTAVERLERATAEDLLRTYRSGSP